MASLPETVPVDHAALLANVTAPAPDGSLGVARYDGDGVCIAHRPADPAAFDRESADAAAALLHVATPLNPVTAAAQVQAQQRAPGGRSYEEHMSPSVPSRLLVDTTVGAALGRKCYVLPVSVTVETTERTWHALSGPTVSTVAAYPPSSSS